MPWLGFRKQQLTEELQLCDKVGHNVNLSLICVALQKGRGTTEERAVQRECRQPEKSSLGVWDTFLIFLNPIQSEGVSKSNSPWIFPFIKTLLGASFEIFSETWPGQEPAAHEELCAFHWSHGSLTGSTGFIYCLFIYRQF